MAKVSQRLASSLPMLRTFEAVARLGSFSAAARDIGVTASAISQQMRLLEGRLGVELFDRHARGLSVTAVGRAFAEEVAQSLSGIDRAVTQLERGEPRGPLAVSTVGSFGARWLVPRLARFRAAFPDVRLLLRAEQRAIDLHTREADLAIRFGPGDYPGLWSTLLMTDRVMPVAAPRYFPEPPSGLADLVTRAALIHDDGIGRHEPALGWRRWVRDSGRAPARPGLHFGDSVLALEATLAGEGVMLARESIAAGLLAEGALVRPIADIRVTDGAYHLVAPRGGPTGAADAFATWVAGEAAAFLTIHQALEGTNGRRPIAFSGS